MPIEPLSIASRVSGVRHGAGDRPPASAGTASAGDHRLGGAQRLDGARLGGAGRVAPAAAGRAAYGSYWSLMRQSFKYSRSRLVCERLTGISVPFASRIFRM